LARKKKGGVANFGTHQAPLFKKGGGRQANQPGKSGRGQSKTQGRKTK
jgi:hypothetical protein